MYILLSDLMLSNFLKRKKEEKYLSPLQEILSAVNSVLIRSFSLFQINCLSAIGLRGVSFGTNRGKGYFSFYQFLEIFFKYFHTHFSDFISVIMCNIVIVRAPL